MKHLTKLIFGVLLALILIVFPLIAGKYHVRLLSVIMVSSIFGVSFYLLLGHTGLMSFGHAAYYGLGAYSTALCLVHFPGFHILSAIAIGSLSGLLAGLIIGLLILRLNRIFLALGTLAFSQMFWAIAWKWRGLTRGDDGMTGWSSKEIILPLLGNFSLSNITFIYYFILIIATITILACWYFTRTPIGNTLISIKSNSERAQFIGVNVNFAKFIVFAFSALVAGVAGSLHAVLEKVVSPTLFDMFKSFDVVLISVFGGYSTFVGPIVGSFFYVYLVEYLSSVTDKWELILGILFIFIVLYYPNGLSGMFKALLEQRGPLNKNG